MHEAGLVAAAVCALASAVDGRPLRKVTLAIGPGVDPGAARHAWEHATAGSPAAQTMVTWARASDTLTCFDCGRDYPGDRLTPCPDCGADGLVTRPAPEVEILDYEITAAPR
ncbi:hydrogenase maturation nickel metallochaperone HypA [Streptomyces sp. YIM S03343]